MVIDLVLAGGRGECMTRSFGAKAKPLVPELGVPLLERKLIARWRAGRREVHVSTPLARLEIGAFVKVSFGEKPSTAIRREIQKELGIVVPFRKWLCVFDDLHLLSGCVLRHHVFSAKVDPAVVGPRMRQALKWFRPEVLVGRPDVHPVVARFLAAQALTAGPWTGHSAVDRGRAS